MTDDITSSGHWHHLFWHFSSRFISFFISTDELYRHFSLAFFAVEWKKLQHSDYIACRILDAVVKPFIAISTAFGWHISISFPVVCRIQSKNAIFPSTNIIINSRRNFFYIALGRCLYWAIYNNNNNNNVKRRTLCNIYSFTRVNCEWATYERWTMNDMESIYRPSRWMASLGSIGHWDV